MCRAVSPESSVRVLSEAGLGSPIPTLFRATTRNSYSTQAFRFTTVAVRVFPSITSGTGDRRGTTGGLSHTHRQPKSADSSTSPQCAASHAENHREPFPSRHFLNYANFLGCYITQSCFSHVSSIQVLRSIFCYFIHHFLKTDRICFRCFN